MIDSVFWNVYERSFNVIRKYRDDNCKVYIIRNGDSFSVNIIKHTAPGCEFVRERYGLDAVAAEEFFKVACRFGRNEIEWTEPVRKFSCKYNPNKSKGCTDKNCPRALGGADYREIFAISCPFRAKAQKTR